MFLSTRIIGKSLGKGKGVDARHGAKIQDEHGKL